MSLDRINAPRFEAWNAGGHNITVVDSVPSDMLHLVDAYWYQFPPMNPLWHGILGFVLTLVGIIAIIGNFVVIFIFTTTKSLRTPSNMFVVNLAISDFMMMVTMFPPMVINCYYETWVLGPFMCELYGLFGSIWGCGSIWSMTMIAYDRYNVIVKGIAGKPLTTTGALLRLCGVWAFALIWTILPMVGWNRYVPEGNMTACGTDYLSKDLYSRSYIVVYSWFVYFTPLLTIIYSYYYIIKAVAAHERVMREQAKKMNVSSLRSSEDANKSAEVKLAKVALVTITLWFIAWTPYLVINYAGIFEAARLSPLATIWGSVFAKCNSVYNPIVYGISHPRYRQALYRRFPCLECNPSGEDNVTECQSQVTTQTQDKQSTTT